jgi:hypothetical protein
MAYMFHVMLGEVGMGESGVMEAVGEDGVLGEVYGKL